MKPENIAVYAGSFDPIHCGHIDIVRDAAKMFSKVFWVLATNSSKSPTFTINERLEMMRLACPSPNIQIVAFDGLIARFAQSMGAQYLVRGLRTATDFDHEFQMALANRQIAQDVTTVYLASKQRYLALSSTLVRELLRNNEPIVGCMPHELRSYIENLANITK